MPVELTLVVENTAQREGLVTEHGLAVHLSAGGRNFMLDTSSTPEALAANAAALGVDLSAIEGVVISHGHGDHVGGLPALLAAREGLKVYAHPRSFDRRRSSRTRHEIGWPSGPAALAEQGAAWCPVESACPLTEEVWISGPVPGPQPDLGSFVLHAGGRQVPDAFADELFVMVRGRAGWAVLTGCCHRGLPNTLRAARALGGDLPIWAVLGGFHLGGAGPDHLAEAAEALIDADPEAVYPCHCTGRRGIDYLAERLPGKVRQAHGGMRLSL